MVRYERQVLRHYALIALGIRSATRQRYRRRPHRTVAKWLILHSDLFGSSAMPNVAPDVLELPFGRVDAASWAALLPLVERLEYARDGAPRSGLQVRLDWLSTLLGLSALDNEILSLVVRAAISRPFHKLADAVQESPGRDAVSTRAIVELTGQPLDTINERLKSTQTLRGLGLIEDRHSVSVVAGRTVLRIARLRTVKEQALRDALLGPAARADLVWDDFAHLGEVRDLASRVLAGALKRRENGVAMLFYGAPGTGKTEFAKSLADRVGARLSFVGEADEEDGEPPRTDRISAFAVARALASNAGNVILAIDEADDIFTGVDEDDGAARTGSKVFVNRLVESSGTPTIWITNHPERLGPAVLRRMALAIRFGEPNWERRRVIVSRILERRKVRFAAHEIEAVARLEAAPAVIAAGIRAAELSGGGAGDAILATRSIVTAMNGRHPPDGMRKPTFDPALSVADHDLADLADRVAAAPGRALSFCFFGLSGTGKTAYARHLAVRLGIDIVERHASELLSMWVGGSERRIAAAFEEAADRRAMLILDEADSLLRDRAEANKRWEVSQVNEMLTRMESAQHPFCCTTNLMGSLERATLRRFLFKVEFRPLDTVQARAAFRYNFAAEPPPELDRLDLLTPGDFAVVARKAEILGQSDAEALLAMLELEVAAKLGAQRRPIGFTAA